ncbi:membrane-anchored junction protein isoform X1 [Cavia porcellus]|uniref:membrane-anchored junction protein isoform X1 n=1 Tax=Cavia porcellus TaxID=10141 RepID=UPI000661E21F|nr:membrane-anchored junction protein [Cavia porcellus]
MSLKPFTYPFPETRFLHAGPSVYKFKIRYGHSVRAEEITDKEVIIQELEDSIRAVLGNLDNLQPFITEHFIVFPYKSKWERVSHLKFKHEEVVLIPYPFVFTLYVEMKWFHENLPPGKPINDSPLGSAVAEKKAAGDAGKKRKLVEEHGSPRGTALPRAKMGSPSRRARSKKPPMETTRNRKKTQQETWKTVTSDTTDVQTQDSKRGHNLPGAMVPALQQSSSPPPQEPGTRSFFGFLSTLFPLRYFFKRSHQ